MTNDDDNLFGPAHIKAYQETGGARGYHWRGATCLLLKTTGRTSGEERIAPLIFRSDGDRYVIVASKGGAPEPPAWFTNLEAQPEAEVQVLDQHIPVRMTVAEGQERTRLWSAMTEVWPDYDAYQAKTDREIPIVVLEPR